MKLPMYRVAQFMCRRIRGDKLMSNCEVSTPIDCTWFLFIFSLPTKCIRFRSFVQTDWQTVKNRIENNLTGKSQQNSVECTSTAERAETVENQYWASLRNDERIPHIDCCVRCHRCCSLILLMRNSPNDCCNDDAWFIGIE